MNDLISFDYHDQPVHIVESDDAPWFVATDVADILSYRDAANMCRLLDDDEKGTQIVSTLRGDQELLIISESGLYNAIFRSRRPEARAFRRWVTGTVLPEIRRTGGFARSTGPLDRLAVALDGRPYVFTREAANLSGIDMADDSEAMSVTAALLRALGWRRAWVPPYAALEG